MSTKMNFELLPNEMIIESFQYLNATDLFHSFDRLNYRFHALIRDIPLHLNFQQLKKSLFNEFCQMIISNSKIKQNIISLQLSNKGTPGQIQTFLSLFLLNDFIHLRSLSLYDTNDDNDKQILPMLPFLSDLYSFSYTSPKNNILEIISASSKSKIRILKMQSFYCHPNIVYKTIPITSLTVDEFFISHLRLILENLPMLKYLGIKCFMAINDRYHISESNIIDAVHLKQLIIDSSSQVDFEVLELMLKHLPNLRIFSIYSQGKYKMFDANRWQNLIESSLPRLHVFNFYFHCYPSYVNNEMLIKFSPFQSDFWLKQHQWYTNYEVDGMSSASIYTIPYLCNEYSLKSTIQRYRSSSKCYLNEYDNVKNLSLYAYAIRKDSACYFRNVQSLALTRIFNGYRNDNQIEECKLTIKQLKYLKTIVNISNIKHLKIENCCFMTSSLLLKILKKIPFISSLTITKPSLMSFLDNHLLCEYLNKVTTLELTGIFNANYLESHEINLLYKIFSNLEQLRCDINDLDVLLFILAKCTKLSMIQMTQTSEHVYSWIQSNASTLNVYFNFTFTDPEYTTSGRI